MNLQFIHIIVHYKSVAYIVDFVANLHKALALVKTDRVIVVLVNVKPYAAKAKFPRKIAKVKKRLSARLKDASM